MADNEQILGQILGELRGIREVMKANHESTQLRINDIAAANKTRFEGIENRLTKTESDHKALLIRTAASGGVSGGVVAVVVEMIRMYLKVGG